MSVISVHTDPENLTLTLVAEFAARKERVWQVWEDPRQLERWWGPPTWPATFVRHELVEGGECRYYMSGPDGEKARGWWKIVSVDAPNGFEFQDGFAGDDGEPSGFLGITQCVVSLEERDGTTRMTSVSSFESAEQLEEMIKMGMDDGMREAAGQIDAILAEAPVR
jgi:uncharacterized protein YndB with AHSA1/START domain